MIRPRLSFMGSRSWGSGKRQNGAGGHLAPPVPGTVPADSEISTILDTYDRKLDEAADQDRAREAARAEFRERSTTILEKIIRPALSEIGGEVLGRGHTWTVEERVDIQGQPAVACLFRPRETKGATGPASELTFRCLFPDRVSTTAVVLEGDVLREFPARSHLVDSVNAHLVQNEVARFLGLVLGRS